MLAAHARWITERVAGLFGTEPTEIRNNREAFVTPELEVSGFRWGVARSRGKASPLREATIFSDSVWLASILTALSRTWAQLPDSETSQEVRAKALFKLGVLLCVGPVQTDGETDFSFAFEEPLQVPDARPGDNTDMEKHRDLLLQFICLHHQLREPDGGEQALANCAVTTNPGAAGFCASWLRSRQFAYGITADCVTKRLLDPEWRANVFRGASDEVVNSLMFFLTEWQLQQTDEWHVRLPQLLACECELAENADRRQLLFNATLLSAISADVVSPVERLLRGPLRATLAPKVKRWLESMTGLARESEPWLAGRIRAVVGSLSRYV